MAESRLEKCVGFRRQNASQFRERTGGAPIESLQGHLPFVEATPSTTPTMNSPTEPVSPSPSTPSSGTPPPEDVQVDTLSPPSSQHQLQGHSPSLTKRRLPSGAGPHSRDVKSRKRDDRGGGSAMSAAAAKWSMSGFSQGEGREGQSKKEELVDVELMEKLRNGMSLSSCSFDV